MSSKEQIEISKLRFEVQRLKLSQSGISTPINRSNIASGSSNLLIMNDSSGSLSEVASGSDGSVLTLASGIPTWSAATAGGVVGDFDTIPSSPHADNLELVGGALNGWTVSGTGSGEVDITSAATNNTFRRSLATIRDSWIFYQTRSTVPTISKAHTFATNEYVVVRITQSSNSTLNSNNPNALLRLVTSGGAPVSWLELATNVGGSNMAYYTKYEAGSFSSIAGIGYGSQGVPNVQYIMIAKKGTSYSAYVASTPGSWIRVGTTTYSPSAPVTVQFLVTDTTGEGIIGVDYIRFFSTWPA